MITPDSLLYWCKHKAFRDAFDSEFFKDVTTYYSDDGHILWKDKNTYYIEYDYTGNLQYHGQVTKIITVKKLFIAFDSANISNIASDIYNGKYLELFPHNITADDVYYKHNRKYIYKCQLEILTQFCNTQYIIKNKDKSKWYAFILRLVLAYSNTNAVACLALKLLH